MYNILLLEDDPILSKEIKEYLSGRSIKCDTVYDGELFFKQIRNMCYDIYVLDINVPKINGLDVCRQVRLEDRNIPILMLTAFGEIEDKVEAFKSGADDYLVKPFHLEELLIRIEALYRRKENPQAKQDFIEIADLKIDIDEKTVIRSGQKISLTPKEFKLICILAKANGRVLSKQQIADVLWDYTIETNQNTIEVYINFLRNKIDKSFEPKLLHTKVGYGYYLKSEAE
jgi:DNA-binding response OmpR family regulator